MRILSFVDVHAQKRCLQRLLEKAARADVLVCAGDLSTFGQGLRSSLRILHTSGKKVLVIPGNHETEDEIRLASRDLKDIVPLHGRIVVIGDCVFVGYGGGGFSLVEEDLEAFVRKTKGRIPAGKKVIFVTHAPPYHTSLDYLSWLHEHRGCKSTVKAIRQLKPALVVCGHFHETAYKSCMMGKTLVINPGCMGKITVV